MGFLDLRCWGCADIDHDTCDIRKIFELEYEGGGKYRCPNCMEISLDLSEYTYNTIIAIDISGNVSVISSDNRMTKDALDGFVSDLDDVSRFTKEDVGIYKCEIYWHYSQCGGEEQEWEMDLEFLSMEEIELNTGD
jgi:hypothetical protein